MKHLKIGLVGLGFAMLLVAVGIALVGSPAQAEMSGVGVKVSNGEVAVNVPTDTALDAFDRFLDRFLLPEAEKKGLIVEDFLGAVSSPDLGSYYVVGGNVFRGFRDDSLTTATTTFCAIQAPVASSTLVSAEIYFDVGSTTEMIVEI